MWPASLELDWLVGVSTGDPLEMSLCELSDLCWVFRTPLWYGVLISNCFALSPIKRLSLAKNGELVVTGETLTATTNLLTFFKIIIRSASCSASNLLPFANCGTIRRYKSDNKRLSREKFDPWSFMNVLTSGANFLAFRLENINISHIIYFPGILVS